jgi:spermidine synthase
LTFGPHRVYKQPRHPSLAFSEQDGGVAEIAETTLASGLHAVIREDPFTPGTYQLVVDGTPQSHVNPDRPDELFFEYISRMGHVIDQLPPGPITALHLGAGALTIPRYVEATRPGSRQQVLELEPDLVALVREHLPWSRSAAIRVRYGDARETLAKLPAGLKGTVDLAVVDIFGGASIPAHVTSAEFYAEVGAFLAPGGVLLVNVADGHELRFARGQAATVRYVFSDTAVLAESGVLKGRRYGNVVIVASKSDLPLEWMPRLLAGGPHPASVVHGRALNDWIAGGLVVSDATATPSPPPNRSVFQVRPGRGDSRRT